MQKNLGLRGNGRSFKVVSRKSKIFALLIYVRSKLATSKLRDYPKSSLEFTFDYLKSFY